MNLWPLRTLALTLNLSAHGVAVTVTRPEPDNSPISTTGIWLLPLDEAQPYGSGLKRKDPRRVLVLPRADVPTVPNGTLIEAPERTGDPVKTWRVEGIERAIEADHFRAVVMPLS